MYLYAFFLCGLRGYFFSLAHFLQIHLSRSINSICRSHLFTFHFSLHASVVIFFIGTFSPNSLKPQYQFYLQKPSFHLSLFTPCLRGYFFSLAHFLQIHLSRSINSICRSHPFTFHFSLHASVVIFSLPHWHIGTFTSVFRLQTSIFFNFFTTLFLKND